MDSQEISIFDGLDSYIQDSQAKFPAYTLPPMYTQFNTNPRI